MVHRSVVHVTVFSWETVIVLSFRPLLVTSQDLYKGLSESFVTERVTERIDCRVNVTQIVTQVPQPDGNTAAEFITCRRVHLTEFVR